MFVTADSPFTATATTGQGSRRTAHNKFLSFKVKVKSDISPHGGEEKRPGNGTGADGTRLS